MELAFLDKLKQRSLLTYYALPQYGIMLKPEVLDLIDRTYLLEGTWDVVVRTPDAKAFYHHLPGRYSCVVLSTSIGNFVQLPQMISEADMKVLLEGKYSRLSPEFKTNVRAYGCMANYVLREDGLVYTDALLMALERHPIMRTYISDLLGVELAEEQELLPCLSEDDFVSFS